MRTSTSIFTTLYNSHIVKEALGGINVEMSRFYIQFRCLQHEKRHGVAQVFTVEIWKSRARPRREIAPEQIEQ